MSHELLLLGEAGSGKSTLLLELALALVQQAEQDQTLLLPVVVPLSSWGLRRPPLEEWLAAQIALHYDIPPSLTAQWVQAGCFALLLDGLDEMGEEARPACIAAINAYHRAHLHPLVVCSRKAEYDVAALNARLLLNQAVMVQPLTEAQVETSLAHCGEPVAALRTALQANPVLQELTTTPLMLSILILTYQGKAVNELPTVAALPEPQRQIWADYVKRMVSHKAQMTHTSPSDLIRWLTFLAQQMRERNQSIFYLEHLQPSSLPHRQRQCYLWMGVHLPAILIGALLSLILTSLFFPIPEQVGLTLPSIALLGGVMGGLLSVETTAQPSRKRITTTTHRDWHLPLRMVTTGGLLGLGFGVSYRLTTFASGLAPLSWATFGLLFGLCGCGLAAGMPLLTRVSRSPPPSGKKPRRRGWRQLLRQRSVRHGLLMGGLVGVSYGLSFGLSDMGHYSCTFLERQGRKRHGMSQMVSANERRIANLRQPALSERS